MNQVLLLHASGKVYSVRGIFPLLLLLLLAAMTYNQVHYFRVNHLADFTQNGHTKTPVG